VDQQIRLCTTTDGVRIAYTTAGSGPPLVKAANWLSHLEFDWRSPVWRHWWETLASGRQLVRYDERGCGLSDWDVEDLSFEAWVRDLEAVVDALKLDRFPLLGISQGGSVSVAYAVRHPERVSHLIIYGAYARGWARRGQTARVAYEMQMSLTRLGWGRDNPAYRQVFTSQFMPEATLEQMRWFNDLMRVSTSPENAVKIQMEFGNIDVVDLLPQVTTPTMVLHCRGDARVPFEEGQRMAALIPNCRFVPLEGKNHLPQEADPCWEPLVAEVRRFLDTPAHATSAGPAPSFTTADQLAGHEPPGLLTAREREVAGPVARGLTNREIAERLVITERTAESHVQHIPDKLGLSSRGRIAAWAVEHWLHNPQARWKWAPK